VYGIVKPFASYNPIWAQIQPFLALAAASAAAPRPLDKLRIWFASPAWRPEGVAPYPGVEDGSYVRRPKYDPVASRKVAVYVVSQFALGVAATTVLMFTQRDAPLPVLVALAAFVILTLATSAGLIEGRPWAKPLEAARLALTVGTGIAALALAR
jgi:hypothetical protein